MALPLYALTLFVSAFILFLVQPIVGKIILPKLGGTPQVWNTCMVFFQMVLLAGYAYTHNATSRLNLRQQLIAHGVLLLLPLVILLPFPFAMGGEYSDPQSGAISAISNLEGGPIEITSPNNHLKSGMRLTISGVEGNSSINGTWLITPINNDKFILDGSRGNGKTSSGGSFVGGTPNPHSLWGFLPDLGSNPIPSTLTILFLYVALPFLVVATSAPLLQKWFVHTGHPAAKDPYFLYGASNLGSMLSLIIYPILVEPYASLKDQGWIYTAGYLALIVFVMACVVTVWNAKDATAKPKAPGLEPLPPQPEAAPSVAQTTGEPQTGVTAGAPAASPAQTAVKPGAPSPKPQGKGKPHGGPEPSIKLPSDDMTMSRRLRWILLAAIPSSLMLGITTHITTDLSPQPMFWLVPLILYLASFIFVFARWPVVWTEGPHRFFLFAQPFCILAMIMVDVLHLTSDTRFLVGAMFAHVLGFFSTTMVCHGELAKDRPSTKHLTEFYLLMSVGGMLGGMFNALIAPVIFQWGIWEFPLCIFAAAIARPKLFETGLLDNFLGTIFESQPDAAPTKPGQKGKHGPVHAPAAAGANESLVQVLDFAWAGVILVTVLVLGFMLDSRNATLQRKFIAYGVPLAMCCLCMARPIRFGLGIGSVLLVYLIIQSQSDANTIHSSRSYFGAVQVKEFRPEETSAPATYRQLIPATYRQLIHGHIDHGMNFRVPENKKDWGNPEKDFSRLATTYYHREGPVGRVMEKFNWFPGPPNTFQADARMPASLVGSGAADALNATLPLVDLVTAWSEPPIATVGLGTGTMASYGRAFQHVHFYEIDNQILNFSLAVPTRMIPNFKEYQKLREQSRRETYFNYLERAIERGATVQVLMGDARLRMALPYRNHYLTFKNNEPDDGGGPENFYHMMVVDAFSSDAIPAHLLTEEAFRMYFDHLTEEGILCVHTSNRFVDLPKVVAAVSAKVGLAQLRGHDVGAINDAERRKTGHYSSEWVMVARKMEYMDRLLNDKFLDKYKEKLEAAGKSREANEPYWASAHVNQRYLWTDDYYNLLSVVRFRPRDD
ncbi:MAG TPA: hypothetical protein VFE62_06105 [Gemmataceae bacterium]|nr:hypothetical protein [Gemmataceae bacterium]